MVQPQSLKPEGVADIPENFLPEFSQERDNTCHQKVTLGSQLLTWHYYQGKIV